MAGGLITDGHCCVRTNAGGRGSLTFDGIDSCLISTDDSARRCNTGKLPATCKTLGTKTARTHTLCL
jgi:hypothetical protein